MGERATMSTDLIWEWSPSFSIILEIGFNRGVLNDALCQKIFVIKFSCSYIYIKCIEIEL